MTDQAAAGTTGDTGATASVDAGAAAVAAAGTGDQGQQQAGQAGNGAAGGQESAVQDWRSGLDGEHAEFAKRIASPHDAVKVAFDLRKANGSMVRVPSADAKPEEVQRFRRAIGVPDKPEDYKADLGRDITDADRPVIDAVAKVMHEHGVPSSAFTAVSKVVTELALAQQGELNRLAEKSRGDAEAALKKEWGGDFDANVALAQRAVRSFGGKEIDALLNTVVNGSKLGDNPLLVRMFGNIGRRMGEGEFLGPATATERSSIQERIDEIMRANPPGTEKYKTPSVQRELAELSEKLAGAGPQRDAGFPGRAV